LVIGFIINPISTIVFGISMLLGSLLGMRDVWSELLSRK
jgi:hypothetical protein